MLAPRAWIWRDGEPGGLCTGETSLELSLEESGEPVCDDAAELVCEGKGECTGVGVVDEGKRGTRPMGT